MYSRYLFKLRITHYALRITIKNLIAKIEGHGALNIDWRKNKVQLNILEGERLFEGILVGREASEAPWITARICGVCPVAHSLSSLRAVEGAYSINVSKTTEFLRELMLCGQILQSHTLHLFFLVAPDYLGLDRATELAKKDLNLFKKALALKKIADEIVYIAGGRSTHPTSVAIGGFYKTPNKEALKKLLKGLEKTKKAASGALSFFKTLDYPKLKVDLLLSALKGDYIVSISSMEAETGKAKKSSVYDYKKDIEEEIRDYSTAKFSRYQGRVMLVGSLARLAHQIGADNEYNLDFTNPFHNILAQAIELYNYHEQAIAITKVLLKNNPSLKIRGLSNSPSLKIREGGVSYESDEIITSPSSPYIKGRKNVEALILKRGGEVPLILKGGKNAIGIGAVEAPRGMLFHEIHLNKKGLIKYANIITPTCQNLTSMEKSSQALLDQSKNRSKEELERLIEMLVRAYDPCITCAVH